MRYASVARQVVEQGAHHRRMRRDGPSARRFRTQASGFQLDRDPDLVP